MQTWLLGYECPDTIMMFTQLYAHWLPFLLTLSVSSGDNSYKLFVCASKKKCTLLAVVLSHTSHTRTVLTTHVFFGSATVGVAARETRRHRTRFVDWIGAAWEERRQQRKLSTNVGCQRRTWMFFSRKKKFEKKIDLWIGRALLVLYWPKQTLNAKPASSSRRGSIFWTTPTRKRSKSCRAFRWRWQSKMPKRLYTAHCALTVQFSFFFVVQKLIEGASIITTKLLKKQLLAKIEDALEEGSSVGRNFFFKILNFFLFLPPLLFVSRNIRNCRKTAKRSSSIRTSCSRWNCPSLPTTWSWWTAASRPSCSRATTLTCDRAPCR